MTIHPSDLPDYKEAIVVSSGGGLASVQIIGSNTLLKNIPVTGANPAIGSVVRVQTIKGRKTIVGWGTIPSGSVSSGTTATSVFKEVFSGPINESQHGSLTGESLHNLATANIGGFMSKQDKAKLDAAEWDVSLAGSSGDILISSHDGYTSFRRLSSGNFQIEEAMSDSNWQAASNFISRAGSEATYGFQTSDYFSYIGGEREQINIGKNIGFGSPDIGFPGGTMINKDGYVSVGTSGPDAPLHISSTETQIILESPETLARAYHFLDSDGVYNISAPEGRIDLQGRTDLETAYTDSLTATRIRTRSLVAERDSSFNGELIVANSSAILAIDLPVPTPGGSSDLYLEMPLDYTGRIFTDNDFVCIREIVKTGPNASQIYSLWGTVVFSENLFDQSPPIQKYIFTRGAGPYSGTTNSSIVQAGATVIGYGQTQGGVLLARSFNSSGANPFFEMSTWDTHPSLLTTQFRAGYLGSTTYPPSGNGVFARNLLSDTVTSDRIRSGSLIAEDAMSFNGDLIVAKGTALLAEEFLLPAAGATGTMKVLEPESYQGNLMNNGDIVTIRKVTRTGPTTESVSNAWGSVVFSSRDNSSYPVKQVYIFTRSSNPNAGGLTGTVAPGLPVINFGQTSGSFLQTRSWLALGGSPYTETVEWTTHPATGTSKTRMGALDGLTGGTGRSGLYINTLLAPTGGIEVVGDDLLFATNYVRGDNGAGQTWSLGDTTLTMADASVPADQSQLQMSQLGLVFARLVTPDDIHQVTFARSVINSINSLLIETKTLNVTDPQEDLLISANLMSILMRSDYTSGSGSPGGIFFRSNRVDTSPRFRFEQAANSPVYLDLLLNTTTGGATLSPTGTGATLTVTAPLITAASVSGASGVNIPHGTAPGTPNNGDLWSTTAGFYGRVNGSTVGPFAAALANGISGSLSTGVLPKASGANALADSILSESGGVITLGGNLNFSGTGRRINGDFNNATRANRLTFQSASDTFTSVGILGGGATRAANLAVYYATDPDNTSYGMFQAASAAVTINASNTGTGAVPSLSLQVSSSTKFQITTAGEISMTPAAKAELTGNFGFIGTSRRITGDMDNATLANRLAFQTSTTDATTNLGLIPNGTATATNFSNYNSSDLANTAYFNFGLNTTRGALTIGKAGTGSLVPMRLVMDADTVAELTTTGVFSMTRGYQIKVTSFSSGPQTLDDSHCYVLCDTGGGAFTVNLPTASGRTGRVFFLKRNGNGTTNAVTVDPYSTETIDGASTKSLANAWSHIAIVSDGTNWLILDI